jgi:hypothetical protein
MFAVAVNPNPPAGVVIDIACGVGLSVNPLEVPPLMRL